MIGGAGWLVLGSVLVPLGVPSSGRGWSPSAPSLLIPVWFGSRDSFGRLRHGVGSAPPRCWGGRGGPIIELPAKEPWLIGLLIGLIASSFSMVSPWRGAASCGPLAWSPPFGGGASPLVGALSWSLDLVLGIVWAALGAGSSLPLED